jgi:thymidylate synthase (FAD)
VQIIKPSVEFLWITENPLKTIEKAGRVCYKSEGKITEDSAPRFVSALLDKGHEAMIEHASMSYKVICDRGVSHEIVRHRLFSYAQESTRYCDYGKSGEIVIIQTPLNDPKYTTKKIVYNDALNTFECTPYSTWTHCIETCEEAYNLLREMNVPPQIARSVLPNALKTEIVITGNFREWRHFFELRTNPKAAHPQMVEVANLILADAVTRVSIVFDEYTRW